jgi:hypothetical protein
LESLSALQDAGLKPEHDEVLSLYKAHADVMLASGTNFPEHEVKYEQSIVAAAVQIITEVYLSTKEKKYLDGLPPLLACLEAFNGHSGRFERDPKKKTSPTSTCHCLL